MALAPRTAAGRVEWSSDVSVLVPVDRSRCSGRILLDVVNRGNTVAVPNFNHATRPDFVPGSDPNPPIDVGDGFLMKRGWVVISCGWQGDVPEVPGLFRMYTPEARDAAGRPLEGRVYSQLQSPVPVRALPPLRPRTHPLPRRRSRREGRRARRARPARRRPDGASARALALRPRRRRAGRPRRALRPSGRRLRGGAPLPGDVHRGRRARHGALHGRAARGGVVAQVRGRIRRAIPPPARSAGHTPTGARRRDGSCAPTPSRI